MTFVSWASAYEDSSSSDSSSSSSSSEPSCKLHVLLGALITDVALFDMLRQKESGLSKPSTAAAAAAVLTRG